MDTAGTVFLDELHLQAGNPCEASRPPIAIVSTQAVAQANATSAVPQLDTAGTCFLDELQLQAGNPCEASRPPIAIVSTQGVAQADATSAVPCEASRPPIATVSTQGVAQADATSAVPQLDTAGTFCLDELQLQAGNPCEASRPPIASVSTLGVAQTNATSAVPELDSAAIVFLDELRLQAVNNCEVTFVDLTNEYFFPWRKYAIGLKEVSGRAWSFGDVRRFGAAWHEERKVFMFVAQQGDRQLDDRPP